MPFETQMEREYRCREFPQVNGLDEIGIRASLKAINPVIDRSTGRCHDDPNRFRRPQMIGYGKAILTVEADIDNDDIGWPCGMRSVEVRSIRKSMYFQTQPG